MLYWLRWSQNHHNKNWGLCWTKWPVNSLAFNVPLDNFYWSSKDKICAFQVGFRCAQVCEWVLVSDVPNHCAARFHRQPRALVNLVVKATAWRRFCYLNITKKGSQDIENLSESPKHLEHADGGAGIWTHGFNKGAPTALQTDFENRAWPSQRRLLLNQMLKNEFSRLEWGRWGLVSLPPTRHGRVGFGERGSSASGQHRVNTRSDRSSQLAHGSLGFHVFPQHNWKWHLLLLSEESGFGWCCVVPSPVGTCLRRTLNGKLQRLGFILQGGKTCLMPRIVWGKGQE